MTNVDAAITPPLRATLWARSCSDAFVQSCADHSDMLMHRSRSGSAGMDPSILHVDLAPPPLPLQRQTLRVIADGRGADVARLHCAISLGDAGDATVVRVYAHDFRTVPAAGVDPASALLLGVARSPELSALEEAEVVLIAVVADLQGDLTAALTVAAAGAGVHIITSGSFAASAEAVCELVQTLQLRSHPMNDDEAAPQTTSLGGAAWLTGSSAIDFASWPFDERTTHAILSAGHNLLGPQWSGGGAARQHEADMAALMAVGHSVTNVDSWQRVVAPYIGHKQVLGVQLRTDALRFLDLFHGVVLHTH